MTPWKRSSLHAMGALAVLACATLLDPAPAFAGPVELFRNAQQNPTNPDQLVAAYIYGGGGFFVSSDGGKTFGLTCSGASNPDLKFERDISKFAISASGDLYVGLFNGLWKGQANGCGWAEVPELKGHIIGGLTVDPIDGQRVYVGTSDGYNPDGTPKVNSVWMKDGAAGTFAQIGKQDTTWYTTLHAVKLTNTTRRFYATGVISKTTMDAMGNPTSEVHYYVRVSDDEGKTWTDNEYDISQFGPKSTSADFEIVAIDPANPNQVLARVHRDMMPDSFVYSPMQGKAGTWQLITEVGELDALAFAPDGKLYFGDDDQNSRAFFVLDKLGDKPRMLSNTWKVGCLHWDASKNRMLACRDWQFGTADLASGAFTSILDMRCGQRFIECPDEATVRNACSAQLLAAYCRVDHYPAAPLCVNYDQGPDLPFYLSSLEYTCNGGQLMSKPEQPEAAGAPAAQAGASAATAGSTAAPTGTAGASGAVAADGGTTKTVGQAGTSTASVAGSASPAPPKKSGCSVGAVRAGGQAGGWWLVLASLQAWAIARRRRARRL